MLVRISFASRFLLAYCYWSEFAYCSAYFKVVLMSRISFGGFQFTRIKMVFVVEGHLAFIVKFAFLGLGGLLHYGIEFVYEGS
jgi:hypothetical protein